MKVSSLKIPEIFIVCDVLPSFSVFFKGVICAKGVCCAPAAFMTHRTIDGCGYAVQKTLRCAMT